MPDCGRVFYALSWCHRHYKAFKRHGDPLGRHLTIAERFWDHVDKSGGPDACWPWTAGSVSTGYGALTVNGAFEHAHRHAYNLTHPDDPLGDRFCLHSCDNPPCCNEKHLRAGTQAENMRDKFERGRHDQRGERHPNHRLTTEQVAEIRRLRQQGVSAMSLARDFGITWGHVYALARGDNWR